jgi:hypothetical protein
MYGLGETALERLAREDTEKWNATYLPHLPGNAGPLSPVVTTLPELVATAKIPTWAMLLGVAILLNWATKGKVFGKGGMWR